MSNVLELKDVCKNYSDFKLDKVSFDVPEGCICGFIGQNGAGKTTTIQLILDSIKRDGGDIQVFGGDVLQEGPMLKEDIGVVFDEMGFHDFMTPMSKSLKSARHGGSCILGRSRSHKKILVRTNYNRGI